MERWRFWVGLGLLLPGLVVAGELADYLQRPEPDYHWQHYHSERSLWVHHHFLLLTSQRWLSEQQVDYPLWQHEIKISRPGPLSCIGRRRADGAAIVVISGGRNRRDRAPSENPAGVASALARGFCRTIVEVRQIPNQPLTFAGEQKGRREDALLAHSMARFMAGEPGPWPAQMAMVKAVIKAMDAVEDFAAEQEGLPSPQGFVLFGASKRGWTAWLTAAQDARVRALVPISIDMPNLLEQFPHHYASYGGYAPALQDYSEQNMGCVLQTPAAERLLAIIDPYAYFDRIQQPKLIINASGDEFFVSDAWRFYFHALQGDSWLRYTPNTDHGQGGSRQRLEYILQARNWVDAVLADKSGKQAAQLQWQRRGEYLELSTTVAPRQVLLWQAENPDGRDFRIETLGPVWQSSELKADSDGRYRATLAAPQQGYRGYFMEVSFGGPLGFQQQVYSTGVYIVPDTLPHAPQRCQP